MDIGEVAGETDSSMMSQERIESMCDDVCVCASVALALVVTVYCCLSLVARGAGRKGTVGETETLIDKIIDSNMNLIKTIHRTSKYQH